MTHVHRLASVCRVGVDCHKCDQLKYACFSAAKAIAALETSLIIVVFIYFITGCYVMELAAVE